MTDSEIIESVTAIATKAHGEQRRKYTPEPYIVHPIRVMEICREYTTDVTVLAAALLHDVLEDTPVTENELLAYLETIMSHPQARRTLGLVKELTDVYIKKDYPSMNRRRRKSMEARRLAAASSAAQTIKYADILDNCTDILKNDSDSFAAVFISECRNLLRVMDKGNPALHTRTKTALEIKR